MTKQYEQAVPETVCWHCGRAEVPTDEHPNGACSGCMKLPRTAIRTYSGGKIEWDGDWCFCAPLPEHRLAVSIDGLAEVLRNHFDWLARD